MSSLRFLLFWGLDAAFLLSATCGWSQGTGRDLDVTNCAAHEALMAPHRNPDAIPPGFEIRIQVGESEGKVRLISDVKMPYGGYIISPTCSLGYKGKFQVNWSDTARVQNRSWSEEPPSELGLEPFDAKMIPMLLRDTRVETYLDVEAGVQSLEGELFMVLEPQCVAYRLPFHATRDEQGWGVLQGRLASVFPE